MKTKVKAQHDDAVVGIVEAVLIIGLLVIVFSILQTVYVPEWMENIEADHLNEVGSEFIDFKHTADLQILTENGLSVTSPITLGSEKLPYLLSQRAYGSLQILDNAFNFTAVNATSTTQYSLGEIHYQSRNSYYIDQSYTYQLGSIIVGQSAGSLLIAPPYLSFNATPTSIQAEFLLSNISSMGSKTSSNGYSTTSIATQYKNGEDITFSVEDLDSFTIETDTPYAWRYYLNHTFLQNQLSFGSSNDYYFYIPTTQDYIQIVFTTTKTNNWQFIIKTLEAQIGPGWIN